MFKLKFSDNQTNGVRNENNTLQSTTKVTNYQTNLFFSSNLPQSYYISMNIMKKFDTNMDAKLSREEFVNGCLTYEFIRKFLTPLNLF